MARFRVRARFRARARFRVRAPGVFSPLISSCSDRHHNTASNQ